jgi:hypothetical protein
MFTKLIRLTKRLDTLQHADITRSMAAMPQRPAVGSARSMTARMQKPQARQPGGRSIGVRYAHRFEALPRRLLDTYATHVRAVTYRTFPYDKFESNSSGAILNPLRRRGVPRQSDVSLGGATQPTSNPPLVSPTQFNSIAKFPRRRPHGTWLPLGRLVSQTKTR